MHLLLHPSAWSDRADDEAENDILAMQVLLVCIGNTSFLDLLEFSHCCYDVEIQCLNSGGLHWCAWG